MIEVASEAQLDSRKAIILVVTSPSMAHETITLHKVERETAKDWISTPCDNRSLKSAMSWLKRLLAYKKLAHASRIWLLDKRACANVLSTDERLVWNAITSWWALASTATPSFWISCSSSARCDWANGPQTEANQCDCWWRIRDASMRWSSLPLSQSVSFDTEDAIDATDGFGVVERFVERAVKLGEINLRYSSP